MAGREASGGGGAKTDGGGGMAGREASGGGGAKTDGGGGTAGRGGGAKTDGGGAAAGFAREGVAGAGSSTAPPGAPATIVRSLRRGGGAGGVAVIAGTGPGVCARGSGMTPVVFEFAVGAGSGTRAVSGGMAGAGAPPPSPSPGSGTAPSLNRTPATGGAGGAAASGGRNGISVWQVLHLSLAPPGGMRRSSMLYAVWQDGHVTRMGRAPEASRLPRGLRGRRTLRR
jgi:hypothetical protein